MIQYGEGFFTNDVTFVTEYEYATVALIAVITGLYGVRRTFHTRANTLFFMMLIFTFMSAATHIITTKTLGEASAFSLTFNYTVNILYLFSYDMIAVMYLLYVLVITHKGRIPLPDRVFAVLVAAADTGLLVSTPWTHLVIYFDEQMKYCHGPLFYLLPGLALFILVYSLVIFIRFRKEIKMSQNISILLFIILSSLATVVQLIRSDQIIGNYAIALSMVLLFNTIEDPADYVDPATGCLNSDALRITLNSKISGDKKFTVIAFSPVGITEIIGPMAIKERRKICDSVFKPFEKYLSSGYIYYINGNKFVVVTEEKKSITAETLVSRISEFFRSSKEVNGIDCRITPFLCTLSYPGFAKNAEEICDTITYSLNQNIKNDIQISAATEDAIKAKQRERHIISTIRNFIADDRFEMYYQPIYSTEKQCFESAEALIRMNDPELGFVSPEEFIPLAEANGYIIRIGELAFRAVCRFIRNSNIRELGIKYVEVNLSTLQCSQETLAERLLQIMQEYEINPDEINFEITETAGLSNYDTLLMNMNRLNAHGISFSMDDYGTGFSTANYLISLPTQIVKIDKSILWPAMENPEALIILRNTIEMLKKLNKKIVVEGVETEEMVNILTEAGCDYLQGFYYSRPVPGEQFTEFLEKYHEKSSDEKSE